MRHIASTCITICILAIVIIGSSSNTSPLYSPSSSSSYLLLSVFAAPSSSTDDLDNIRIGGGARPRLLSRWSVSDVQGWLDEFQITDPNDREFKKNSWKKYMNVFKENQVDGEALLTITEDELREVMLVSSADHRRILLSGLYPLREAEEKRQAELRTDPMTKEEKEKKDYRAMHPHTMDDLKEMNKKKEEKEKKERVAEERRAARLLKKNLIEVEVEDDPATTATNNAKKQKRNAADEEDLTVLDEDEPSSGSSSASSSSDNVDIHPDLDLGDLSSFSPSAANRIRTLEASLFFARQSGSAVSSSVLAQMVELASMYLDSASTVGKAKLLLDRALSLDENNPEVINGLGDFDRLTGAMDKAIKHYQHALQLNPLGSSNAGNNGNGAIIRMNLADSLYLHALNLFNDKKEYECKLHLEQAVNSIVEALHLLPHPSYVPWLTPSVYQSKLARYQSLKHVTVSDPQYRLHDFIHRAKVLLAECYLKLSVLYEKQANIYWRRLYVNKENVARFEQWSVPLVGAPPVELPGFNHTDKAQFFQMQNHTVHLFALSYSYLDRIHRTIHGSYIEKLKNEQGEKLGPVYEESLAGMKRLNKSAIAPWRRKHEAMMHDQEVLGRPMEGFYVYQAFLKQKSIAERKILAAQYTSPVVSSSSFFSQRLLAAFMSQSCKNWAANEMLSYIRAPIKQQPILDQTLSAENLAYAHRGEEDLLQSSRYPLTFNNRKEMRLVRAVWERRLDDLLKGLQLVDATDAEKATAPPAVSALIPLLSPRWFAPSEIERTRFSFLSLFHGLSNLVLQSKLNEIYRGMTNTTTTAAQKAGRPATSWLDYRAKHLRDLYGVNGLEGAQMRVGLGVSEEGTEQATSSSLVLPRRIRIAFLSAFFTAGHPMLQSLMGYIEHLDRSQFQVQIFWVKFNPLYDDSLRNDVEFHKLRRIINTKREGLENDIFVEIPRENLLAARHASELHRPDLLVFGSDFLWEPSAMLVQFARLAPVQAVWGGTGIVETTGGGRQMDQVLLWRGMEQGVVEATEADAEEQQQQSNATETKKLQSYFSERIAWLDDVGYWSMPNFTQHLLPLSPQQLNDTSATNDTTTASTPAETFSADVKEGFKPKFDRSFYDLSEEQLVSTFQIPFSDSQSPLAPFNSTHPRTVYFVAESDPYYYSPAFVSALGSILARDPSSVLLLSIDPQISLSKGLGAAEFGGEEMTGEAGEEDFYSISFGMKNQCKDLILGRIEKWITQRNMEMNSSSSAAAASSFRAVDETKVNPALIADSRFDYLGDLTATVSNVFTPEQYAKYVQSGRVRFQPKQHATEGEKEKRVEYLNLLENVDVMLQPFPIDNLMSAFDALVVNLPTVYSSFSPTASGRYTHSVFSRLNLTSTSASNVDSYVSVAVSLGTDRSMRRAVAQQMESRKATLYEDSNAVRHMEQWATNAVTQKVQQAISTAATNNNQKEQKQNAPPTTQDKEATAG